jgi:hypothetical protein
MDHETEVIKQRMADTRESLSEKIDTLEQKVIGTVQGTAEAVQGTVTKVKDTVDHTVEKVKETLDLRQQVERHPWGMFAGSIALGCIGGYLLTPPQSRYPVRESHLGDHPERWTVPAPPSVPASAPTTGALSEPTGPRPIDMMLERFEPALNKLKELAIGATANLVGEMLLSSVPKAMRKDLAGVIDEFTAALGGKPLPHDPASETCASSSSATLATPAPILPGQQDNWPHNRLASTKGKGGNGRSSAG